MDTSKLLENATEILRPYIKILGFQKIDDYLKDFTDEVHGTSCTFRFWSYVEGPLDFRKDMGMVYPISLARYVRNRRSGVEVVYYRLLLCKSPVGGLHTAWCLHESEFRPVEDSQTYFNSTKSAIIPIDDEDLAKRSIVSLEHFKASFYDQLRAWVEAGRQSRQSALASLDKLESLLPKKD